MEDLVIVLAWSITLSTLLWALLKSLIWIQKQDPTMDQFELASEFTLTRDGKLVMRDSMHEVLSYLMRVSYRVIYKPKVMDCKGNLIRDEEVIKYDLRRISVARTGDNAHMKYILTKYVNGKVIANTLLIIKPV